MPAEGQRRVAGLVMAAGSSTRMGSNKLLFELGGESVVRRVVRSAIAARLDPVCVVLGHEADRVRHALHDLAYEEVVNDGYDRGINGSVQLGIRAVRDRVSAAIVLLADMPLVTTDMVTTMVDRYRATTSPLVISRYGDVRAPPTLYDHSLFPDFTDDHGEGCGRRIVKKHLSEAVALDWPAEILTDLDSPPDYEKLKTLVSEVAT